MPVNGGNYGQPQSITIEDASVHIWDLDLASAVIVNHYANNAGEQAYRMYNLGEYGDTDTEFGYIEYDSGTGILKFGVDATGSGSTSRPVNFYTDSSFGFKATGGTTRFNISASNVVTYLHFLPNQDSAKNLGSDATRFARAYVTWRHVYQC